MLCPCCGKDMPPDAPGCSCGARFVGAPLDEAPIKVQRFGPAMTSVALLVAVTIAALVFTKYLAFAGLLVVWSARRAMRLARKDPEWYGGYRAVTATLAVTLLGGVVASAYAIAYIPQYLENRRVRQEAATIATFYEITNILEEYKRKNRNYPPDELAIKKAINQALPRDYWDNHIKYQGYPADIAGRSPKVTGISFSINNFELRSAGPDGKMETDDDIIMRDGIFLTSAEAKKQSVVPSVGSN